MFKYITVFLLLIYSTSFAEIIKKIEVSGNKRVSEETIKVYGEVSVNDDFSKFDFDKVLKNLYSTDFFEDIKLDFNNGILSIVVKEYPVINSITIEGEEKKKVRESVLERLQSKEKGSFIKNILTKQL